MYVFMPLGPNQTLPLGSCCLFPLSVSQMIGSALSTISTLSAKDDFHRMDTRYPRNREFESSPRKFNKQPSFGSDMSKVDLLQPRSFANRPFDNFLATPGVDFSAGYGHAPEHWGMQTQIPAVEPIVSAIGEGKSVCVLLGSRLVFDRRFISFVCFVPRSLQVHYTSHPFNEPYSAFDQLPVMRCSGDNHAASTQSLPFPQDNHVMYQRQAYIANQRPCEFSNTPYLPDLSFGKAWAVLSPFALIKRMRTRA